MTAENEDENEPVNLTEKLRSEITEVEPMNVKLGAFEPAPPVVEPEDEKRFEETVGPAELPPTPKTSKTKTRGKTQATTDPISKFQSELRRHSDARKRTDLAIKDIQRELKDILLVHHATIRELQKQVRAIQKKIATTDSSKKYASSKTSNKKITGSKNSGKKIKNLSAKKSKRR